MPWYTAAAPSSQRDPGREAVGHEACVDRSAALLRVEVGAIAPRQEAEAVVEAVELRGERVGHACLEPAVGARRDAAERHSVLGGLPQRLVDAVKAPDREHVRRVAAGHDDDVGRGHALRRTVGYPEV